MRNKTSRLLIPAIAMILLSSCVNGQEHSINEKWLNSEKLAQTSTVVLNNESKQLPVISLELAKIASVDLGFAHHTVFDSLLNKYTKVDAFAAADYLSKGSLNGLHDDTKLYNTLVVQVSEDALADPRILSFIRDAELKKQVIIALFGSGKGLSTLNDVRSPILWTNQYTPEAASFVAQAVFGGVGVDNKLTQNMSSRFLAGMGATVPKIRLKYTVPEEAGINAGDLHDIDEVAAEMISKQAAPGSVVMVVKDGMVIFNKAYGSHTYDRSRPEKVDDIFDLASVTKISATTMAVMHLTETGQLSMDSTLSKYIARTRGTNRENIKVKEVMMHQAGFVPYIPFHQKIAAGDFSTDSSEAYPTQVAENYFIRKNYFRDVMWPQMLTSRLDTRGRYVYSDLSMYYMKEIVEGLTHEPIDQYVLNNLYRPLGMQTAGFNPRRRFAKDRIVPTENDTYFRKSLLQGYVHDQGAAMVGGVSGHAGLFASANDLAILFQTILNGGSYGGKEYFKPATIDTFTKKQSTVSRRGYGFDRWDPEVSKKYPAEFASSKTFGHTGYTGTCVWVDPESSLIYIFLSNRVYPTVTERLANLNIRPRIMDVVYKAIRKSNDRSPAQN